MEIVVHSINSVSIKISKETTPFQQARATIPNLGVECINYSVRLLMSKSEKKWLQLLVSFIAYGLVAS